MQNKLIQTWKENRSFILFMVLMFAFRSAIADWNEVPTGSMNPTIVEGDRILVNKLAYDIQLPFTSISLAKLNDPDRGDIVIFNSEVSGKRLVKRVIGIPGDTVKLENNILTLNDIDLDYQVVSVSHQSIDRLEYLAHRSHTVRNNKNTSRFANFPSINIPDNYYLVLGDNRDNSADSRVIGLVPRSEIIGRSRYVVLSLDYDNYYIPRRDRFFHTL